MKLKFGYDLSGLTAYVNEEKLPLLTKAVFSGDTVKTFEVQQGIKYKDVLNYLDTEVIFRANTGCSTFTATGDTTFTQKEISVDAFMHEQAFCPDDLEDYWTRAGMQSGSYQDTMAFEREWTSHYADLVNKEVELMLWQGNKSTGSGNLALINGLIYSIDNDGTAIDGNPTNIATGTGITTGNVVGIFNGMITLIPVDVEGADDIMFSCGWDTFKKLLSALQNLNNFYYDGINANPYKTGEFTYPTFGIKVKAFKGLTGTNRIFLHRSSNFVIGTDLENDWENFQMWYEQKDDKILTRLKAKLGTQIKFGNEMVEFTLV